MIYYTVVNGLDDNQKAILKELSADTIGVLNKKTFQFGSDTKDQYAVVDASEFHPSTSDDNTNFIRHDKTVMSFEALLDHYRKHKDFGPIFSMPARNISVDVSVGSDLCVSVPYGEYEIHLWGDFSVISPIVSGLLAGEITLEELSKLHTFDSVWRYQIHRRIDGPYKRRGMSAREAYINLLAGFCGCRFAEEGEGVQIPSKWACVKNVELFGKIYSLFIYQNIELFDVAEVRDVVMNVLSEKVTNNINAFLLMVSGETDFNNIVVEKVLAGLPELNNNNYRLDFNSNW